MSYSQSVHAFSRTTSLMAFNPTHCSTISTAAKTASLSAHSFPLALACTGTEIVFIIIIIWLQNRLKSLSSIQIAHNLYEQVHWDAGEAYLSKILRFQPSHCLCHDQARSPYWDYYQSSQKHSSPTSSLTPSFKTNAHELRSCGTTCHLYIWPDIPLMNSHKARLERQPLQSYVVYFFYPG